MFSLQSKKLKEFFSHLYVLKHNMPKPLRKVRDEKYLPASNKNECEGKSYLHTNACKCIGVQPGTMCRSEGYRDRCRTEG